MTSGSFEPHSFDAEGGADITVRERVEFTAKKRHFRVLVDGKEVSKHYQEREALEAAANVYRDGLEVKVIHDYEVRVVKNASGKTVNVRVRTKKLKLNEPMAIVTYTSPGLGQTNTDTTPNAFTWVDQTNVALSTVITSNWITILGINSGATITVSGTNNPQYQINSEPWTNAAGTVNVNDSVRVRHTSSAFNSIPIDTVVTIGGVSDTFTSTTKASGTFDFETSFESGTVGNTVTQPPDLTNIQGPSVYQNNSTYVRTGSQSIEMRARVGNDEWGIQYDHGQVTRGGEAWYRYYLKHIPGFDYSATGAGLKTFGSHVSTSGGGNVGRLFVNNASGLPFGGTTTYTDPTYGDQFDLHYRGSLKAVSEVSGSAGAPAFSEFGNYWYNEGLVLGSEPDASPHIGPGIVSNVWICLEQYVKADDRSRAEGGDPIQRAWQDGVLIFSDTVNRTMSGVGSYLDHFQIYSFWNNSGIGDGPNQDQEAYCDDFVFTTNANPPTNTDSFGNLMIGL